MASKPHLRFSLQLHVDAVGWRAIRALVVLVACAGTLALSLSGSLPVPRWEPVIRILGMNGPPKSAGVWGPAETALTPLARECFKGCDLAIGVGRSHSCKCLKGVGTGHSRAPCAPFWRPGPADKSFSGIAKSDCTLWSWRTARTKRFAANGVALIRGSPGH
jgi:hypothetical protein